MGPLIPLVFTLTTIGGRLNLCVTYRTTSFSEKNARMVTRKFVDGLEGWRETPKKIFDPIFFVVGARVRGVRFGVGFAGLGWGFGGRFGGRWG